MITRKNIWLGFTVVCLGLAALVRPAVASAAPVIDSDCYGICVQGFGCGLADYNCQIRGCPYNDGYITCVEWGTCSSSYDKVLINCTGYVE